MVDCKDITECDTTFSTNLVLVISGSLSRAIYRGT